MRKARTIVGAGRSRARHRSAGSRAGRRRGQAFVAAFAANAGAVNGIKASRTPKAGRLVPLGRNAKLPASVVPSRRGARGRTGRRIGRATGPGWAAGACWAPRGCGPGGGEGQPRRAGEHACRDRSHFGGLILRPPARARAT